MRLKRTTKKILYYVLILSFGGFILVQFNASGKSLGQRENIGKLPSERLFHRSKPLEARENEVGLNIAQPVIEDAGDADTHNELEREQDEGGEEHGPESFLTPGKLGNYEPKGQVKVTGPGENGEPVYSSLAEKSAVDRALTYDGFDMVASDKIALNRTIPDSRLEECKYWQYPPAEQLPKASVVIIFYDEGWSPLQRTITSVINTSPPALLHEVVVVDDFSERDEYQPGGKFYQYNAKHYGNKVKIYRTPKREGLIRARNFGAMKSTGDVVVFLDAHCECNRNWLPPLLARIAYDRTILAIPIVDGIDGKTFRYTAYSPREHMRGIFEWGFFYKELVVPRQELQRRKHNSEPYRSPTHAGGLLAIDRKYFWELGGYDPGLLIWGGENFELAFKIWQCGGSSEWVPCSRIGHVYRAGQRRNFKSGIQDSHKKPLAHMNYKRVVEVWFDDKYKEYFYNMIPEIRKVGVGDLSKQFEIKKKYNCKSFQWFMDNVAYDLPQRYPYPPPLVAWGEIATLEGNRCFDNPWGDKLLLYGCHHSGGSQMFRFNTQGQIARGERMVIPDASGQLIVKMSDGKQSGPWEYRNDTSTFYHKERNECMDSGGNIASVKPCDPTKPEQKWVLREVHPWKHLYTE